MFGNLRQPVVGGLHRRVDGVESEVEEPWLGLVPLDERHRLAPEGVGGVVQFLHRLGAAQDAAGVEVIVRAAEEAEELVEAALLRVHLRQRAEVPFADETGDVAGGLEPVGDGLFAHGQPVVAAGIELVAEALLVAPRHQPRARWRAIRPADVAIGEPHARRPRARRGCGVGMSLQPWKPTSAYPISSPTMKRMLGFAGVAVMAWLASRHSDAKNVRVCFMVWFGRS